MRLSPARKGRMLSPMTPRNALLLITAAAGLACLVLSTAPPARAGEAPTAGKSAGAPCVDCRLTSSVLGGVKLTYPAVLKRHGKPDAEPWLNMEEARFGVEHGSLGFFVQPVRSGHEDEILDRWRNLKEWANKRTVNGWEVLEEATSDGTRRTTLLGRHRVVTVDMVVEPEFTSSDLSHWLERAFAAAVDNVATKNSSDVGAAPPAPADAVPAAAGA